MAVTDAKDGRQVERVAIGKGPDGAALDPQARVLFSSYCKFGTPIVVQEDDPEHVRVVQILVTQHTPA